MSQYCGVNCQGQIGYLVHELMLYKYCPVQKKLCQDGKINGINNTIIAFQMFVLSEAKDML